MEQAWVGEEAKRDVGIGANARANTGQTMAW